MSYLYVLMKFKATKVNGMTKPQCINVTPNSKDELRTSHYEEDVVIRITLRDLADASGSIDYHLTRYLQIPCQEL